MATPEDKSRRVLTYGDLLNHTPLQKLDMLEKEFPGITERGAEMGLYGVAIVERIESNALIRLQNQRNQRYQGMGLGIGPAAGPAQDVPRSYTEHYITLPPTRGKPTDYEG